jgi:hypothetical protein
MSDITESLTRKLGPLPVWVWGVLAGGAISAGRWAWDKNKNSGTAAVDPAADAGASPAVPASASGAGAAGLGGDYGYPNSGAWEGPPATAPTDGSTPAAGTPATTPAETNAEWVRRAVAALIAAGTGPLVASEAIRKYLAGEPVTPAEQALISSALQSQGMPPEGAPPLTAAAPTNPGTVNTTPPPAPTPAPAPAPAPSPAPTVPAGRRQLWEGAEGEDVARLQRWLNKATAAGLTVDGKFGTKTKAAVAKLQQFMSGGSYSGQLGVLDAQGWGIIDYVAAVNSIPF